MSRELEHISLTFGTAVYVLVLLLHCFKLLVSNITVKCE